MNKCYLYFILLHISEFISIIYLYDKYVMKYVKNKVNKESKTNKHCSNKYECLFDSLEYDYYNFSMIYNKRLIVNKSEDFSNTIKIKHKINKKKIFKSTVCIFGVLVNEKGLEIEKSMLDWLLPEYDVYCVYQKYPGIFYEYPALRFAQWFSLNYNISIILYLHTKGAFNCQIYQDNVRSVWKHEFTKPRNNIYINVLSYNISDISLPFRTKVNTWFNGMFISNRAFNLIHEIKYIKEDRWYYEQHLFNTSTNTVRIKGILNDTINKNIDAVIENNRFVEDFKKIDRIKYKTNMKDKLK